MKIALLAYKITPNAPSGSCVLQVLQHLYNEHEFTVFSTEFDNPAPDLIKYVHVPIPLREPPLIRYIISLFITPLVFYGYRVKNREKFDIVQTISSDSFLGNMIYSHYCNRHYVNISEGNTPSPISLRMLVRRAYYLLNALLEPIIYKRKRIKKIVAVSVGHASDLINTFGEVISSKVEVIYNPVDVDRMTRSQDFDGPEFRGSLGFESNDRVMVFVALGHFERKGMPLILEALSQINSSRLKLLVVGGRPGLINIYKAKAKELNITQQVNFVGFQSDVRPYLWCSDAFVLPSVYENFSLASLEAAAAGLLMIATSVNGVEEFMQDGETGWVIERNVGSLKRAMEKLLDLSPGELERMGRNAAEAVKAYDLPRALSNT